MDINNPKIRWAQQIADSSEESQAIIKNMLGDYDIKRASAVIQINNPDLVCIIEPRVFRDKNVNDKVNGVLSC
jgi:hypothetical protein